MLQQELTQNAITYSALTSTCEKEKQTEEEREEGWRSHLGDEGSETTTILIRSTQ